MAIVDDAGAVQNSYTYDVYGDPTVTGSLPNEYDFAGQGTDASTGLQYLRARYMDPETGVFLSREPLASAPSWSGATHGYVGANPIIRVDPTGLWSVIPPMGGCLLGLGPWCRDDDNGPPSEPVCDPQSPPEACLDKFDDYRRDFEEWEGEQIAELVALIGEYLGPSPFKDSPKRVTGFTRHGINQAISRDGHGVSTSAIRDALKNPREIWQEIDITTGQRAWRYIGKDAIVWLNDAGQIITTRARNSRGWRY
jgi:RHS repeat-associated protein